MSEPTAAGNPGACRAEDAIRSIFALGADDELDPHRMTCLAFVAKGDRRCSYFDSMQIEEDRCRERRLLIDSFLTQKFPEHPIIVKEKVLRFVKLAVCHKYHINKMQDAAEDWFDKYKGSSKAVPARPVTPVNTESPLRAKSPEVRHYSTSPTPSIEMREYLRGRDEEQLRRLIEEPLDTVDCREGQVYITMSPDVPGYIKIGYTCQSLERRFEYALRDCRINIKLMYATGVLPHAKRLEAIIHNELAEKRFRFAQPCTFCISYPKKHEEWFQTTVEYARGVAEYWKEWLLRGMYDRDRRSLSPKQRVEIIRLASPENIKERKQRLSPEPERTLPPAVPLSERDPPDSPTPVRRSTSQSIGKDRVLGPPSSSPKEIKIEPCKNPTTSILTPPPSEKKLKNDEASTVLPQAKESPEETPISPPITPVRQASHKTNLTECSSETQVEERRVQRECSTEEDPFSTSPVFNLKILAERRLLRQIRTKPSP